MSNNQHSVIFIEHPGIEYERLNKSETNVNKNKFLNYFILPPLELPNRILSSFIPPIFGSSSRKIYVDLVGPILALVLLASVLEYGHSNKYPNASISVPPTITLLYYITFSPILCLAFAKAGNANIDVPKILALFGYGLYGQLLTVSSSFLLNSNVFFYIVLTIFGGASCLKIVLVFLLTIPKPVCRLLICSLVSMIYILFIVFIHFAYMHRTFIYGINI